MSKLDSDRGERERIAATMEPREINAMMMNRIGQAPPQPYTEGRHVLRIIDVRGRRTGEPRPFPIAVTQHDGRHYLCAPTRRRDWVRNLLAAGECEVRRDEPARVTPVLVGADEAIPVVRTYLGGVERPSAEWPFPADAAEEQVREHAQRIAVIRLDPAQR